MSLEREPADYCQKCQKDTKHIWEEVYDSDWIKICLECGEAK